jgi:hypothetical protein
MGVKLLMLQLVVVFTVHCLLLLVSCVPYQLVVSELNCALLPVTGLQTADCTAYHRRQAMSLSGTAVAAVSVLLGVLHSRTIRNHKTPADGKRKGKSACQE